MVAILDYDKLRDELRASLLLDLQADIEKLVVTKRYYTVKEACTIFGKTAPTLEHWHKIGKLCYGRVTETGDKIYCVDEVNALRDCLRQQREERYGGRYDPQIWVDV